MSARPRARTASSCCRRTGPSAPPVARTSRCRHRDPRRFVDPARLLRPGCDEPPGDPRALRRLRRDRGGRGCATRIGYRRDRLSSVASAHARPVGDRDRTSDVRGLQPAPVLPAARIRPRERRRVRRPGQNDPMAELGILVVAFVAGSIPFSTVRAVAGVDPRGHRHRLGHLPVPGRRVRAIGVGGHPRRRQGRGRPGARGPRANRRSLRAARPAVVGHNWSPFLRGAGGRGISPRSARCSSYAWPGAVVLLVGMILGKVFGETAVGALVAEVALTPVLAVTHGAVGALAGHVHRDPDAREAHRRQCAPATPGWRRRTAIASCTTATTASFPQTP